MLRRILVTLCLLMHRHHATQSSLLRGWSKTQADTGLGELAGAPGAQASEARSSGTGYSPDVRVRFHDTNMDAPRGRHTHADYWAKDGLAWVRHHQQERCGLYVPVTEPGGPDTNPLDDT